jgi:hypothetical protein
VRFFRIPGFTGIEAHRDDADRGSLRVVEGCLPFGTGGLRSGPVWEKIRRVEHFGDDDRNLVSAMDDGKGNSLVFVSRNCQVHSAVVFPEENTDIESLGESYDVATPVPNTFSGSDATISSIGNRLFAVGDGTAEALYIGKGPVLDSNFSVYPDETLYKQEWSRFPNCRYYARGPKATLFAAGNPDKPLTVYISEPAGLTEPLKDSPYSTEFTGEMYNAGRLSTVEILGSDASKITALSTRGDQVVVHTDKGAFLLYAPAPDQASTGYRVEQAPATNFSSAVNHKVVSGGMGAQTFWVGHDGQVYKDEAASRGSAELKSNADQDQANWKSKGVWEHELPSDLSQSFSAFSGQTGDYFFFVESEEAAQFNFNDDRLNGIVDPNAEQIDSYVYVCGPHGCNIANLTQEEFEELIGATDETDVDTIESLQQKLTDEGPWCCKRVPGLPDPASGKYATCRECQESTEKCSETGCCCQHIAGFDVATSDQATSAQVESWGVSDWFKSAYDRIPNNLCCPQVSYYTWKLSTGQNFGRDGCRCEQTEDGTGYETYEECMAAAMSSGNCLWDYNNCGPCEQTANGSYFTEESCKKAIAMDEACESYDIVGCDCVKNEKGTGTFATLTDCEEEINTNDDYEICWNYLADEASCSCSRDSAGTFTSLSQCTGYLETISSCVKYTLDGCDCSASITGDFDTLEACKEAASLKSECLGYKKVDCECVRDTSDNPEFSSSSECITELNLDPICNTYDLLLPSAEEGRSNCRCVRNPNGSGLYQSAEECEAAKSAAGECTTYAIQDCECVESSTGFIAGKEACEAQLAITSECIPYQISADCVCEPAEDGAYMGITACESERLELCATFDIENCTCTENTEGEGDISGLSNCHTALGLSPYAENCGNYFIANCQCIRDPYGGGTYATINECNAAKPNHHSCDNAEIPWRFPIQDPFNGVVEDGCRCVQDAGEGVYYYRTHCQDALEQFYTDQRKQYWGIGNLYPLAEDLSDDPEYSHCYACEGTFNGTGAWVDCCPCEVFGPEYPTFECNPGDDIPTSYFCSAYGGTVCCETTDKTWGGDESCDRLAGPCTPNDSELGKSCNSEHLTRQCSSELIDPLDPDSGTDCDTCPDAQWMLFFDMYGGCYCEEGIYDPSTDPDNEILRFNTEEECLGTRDEHCLLWAKDSDSCDCVKHYDGDLPGITTHADSMTCDAWVQEQFPETCVKYGVSDDCVCVKDSVGLYWGQTECEQFIKSTSGCEDHYVNSNCECVISEPAGNEDPPFNGIKECQTALNENTGPSRCHKYNLNSGYCTCDKTIGGNYTGLESCTAALETDPACKPYWLTQECSCVDTDPGDGSIKYDTLTDCDNATTADPKPAFCCDNNNPFYMVMTDTYDGVEVTECFNMESAGEGFITECACIEANYNIVG